MEANVKILCPPMLDYLLHRPPSMRDYDALPLFLIPQTVSAEFVLVTSSGRRYADASRLDQFNATRVFGAFDLAVDGQPLQAAGQPD